MYNFNLNNDKDKSLKLREMSQFNEYGHKWLHAHFQHQSKEGYNENEKSWK